MIEGTVVLEICVIGAAVLNLAANGLAVYRRLRAPKGSGDLWKAGYGVGLGHAIERFQRVPGDLLATGRTTRKHVSKLTVEFNANTTKLLDELAEELDTSKVEVVRKALTVYKYLSDEVKSGKKVAIAEDSKVLKELIIR